MPPPLVFASDQTIVPDGASPRRRLGDHLASGAFELKDCIDLFGVVGQNEKAKMGYVTKVGFDLTGIIYWIWNDDPSIIAKVAR